MYTCTKTYFNPVMAILVSPATIRKLRKQITNPRIKLMVEANEGVNNTLYYFSLKQVKLQKQKITGYYWHSHDNRWQREEFPIPDILYIRGDIAKKYTPVFEELFDIVNRRGKVINYPRFDKWQLYQIINKDPLMKDCLPVTREVNQPEDIEKMLQDYQVVYLKSHLGRKGYSTLRVEALPDGCYQYSYQKNDQLTTHKADSFPSLLDAVKEFFSGKRYVVQEAIKLIRYKNRLVDMRAELQRKGDGRLEITGIAARLGRPGSPITTHSDAFRFDDFFENMVPYPKEKLEALQSSVHDFLLRIYKDLEEHYGEYVEIGIDFGIDINDKLWLIEANSQSAKVSLEKAYDQSVLSRAYRNVLEYARYMFKKTRGSLSIRQVR